MQKLIVTTSALLILISCSQQKDQAKIEQRITNIENSLTEFTSPAAMFQRNNTLKTELMTLTERMEHYNTPGVSIAAINNNKIEWSKVYGTMDVNTGVPVTFETIFEAASTSKFITAVLVLHYVEKGLIDLDHNVNDYLKTWQVPENEFTQIEKVTLRRLLTHKAGLPTTNYSHDENIGYPTLLDVLNGELPALNKPAIPEIEPGSVWQYSNVAFNVIQLLLEDISGKTFQELAKEMMFDPLEMNRSTFLYPLDSDNKIHEAMPHDAEGNSLNPSMHFTALAHGGLTTTPIDLAKFTNEIMLSYRGKSEKIISQEMVKKLFNKEFDLDPRMFGIPLSEGLGVLLIELGDDLIFAHPGSNLPGLNCWLIGWSEKGSAIIIMTNGAMGEVLSMEIIQAFINEYELSVGV